MNCFNHQDRPAVGVCKHCYKAVCRECISDVGVVACSPQCAAQLQSIEALVNAAPRARRSTVFMLSAMGAVMLLLGAAMRDAAGVLIAFMGVVMFVGAYFQRGKRGGGSGGTARQGATYNVP